MRINCGKVTYGKLLRRAEAENKDPLDLLNEATQRFNGQALTGAINGFFRYKDRSWQAPVFGRYNVTERAIRKLRKDRSDGCGPDDGYPYILALDQEIGNHVNRHF